MSVETLKWKEAAAWKLQAAVMPYKNDRDRIDPRKGNEYGRKEIFKMV